MTGVYYKNHTKHKILCVVKNVEILDAKEGGKYHCHGVFIEDFGDFTENLIGSFH